MPEQPPDRERELLRQQDILAQFGELAVRSDDLDEILTEACRLVGDALGTDLAKVMELQDDGITLKVRAGVGWQPGVVGQATGTAEKTSSEGHALHTGAAVISPDINTETRFEYPDFIKRAGVRALVNAVIIGGKGRPHYGLLQVDSRQPRDFSDNDTKFLRSYANLIAAAVDRLRTTGELRNERNHLRESMNRQNAALETGLIGFFEWNVAAGTLAGDRSFASFYGLDPEVAAAGVPFSSITSRIHPEDRDEVEAKVAAALTSLADYKKEFRLVLPNGETVWLMVRGRCYEHEAGRPLRYTGTAVDVSLQKQSEQALRRINEELEAKVEERTHDLTAMNARLRAEAEERERVEEALRQSHKMEAVGQLTGGLAHDFNNLLTAMSGSLELMTTRLEQGRFRDLNRYIATAQEAGRRAAALTHRLLAFSRRQTLAPRLTNINDLVAGMEEMIRRTVGPAARVGVSGQPELWATLIDPNQLESALLNLCINARDAMPDGGQLTIKTANEVLDRRAARERDIAPGEYVSLCVTDTGTGMTPDVIKRAFDPFFTTKPLGQGTGLGLSMIYGFARQSGGQVRIASDVGEGTTVCLHLPRHVGVEDSAEALVEPSLARPALRGETVLVVDDEAHVRMLVTEVLDELGYGIIEAADGAAALRVLQSNARVDLLITDVGLPGTLNGRQVADAARQDRPNLTVLFITGYAESAVLDHGQLGPDMHILTKPFSMQSLEGRIKELLVVGAR